MRSPARHLDPPLGFTLIELVVAMTIALVVIAGVVSVVNGQQKAYQNSQQMRAAQSSARAALQYMEQELAMAGYGVDPAFAFDFDKWYTTGPCSTDFDSNGQCTRDSTANADELVFIHRDPNYWVDTDNPATSPTGKAWLISSASSSSSSASVVITVRAGDVFPKGQIVQAVCRGGKYYTYATVDSTQSVSGAGSYTLALNAPDTDDPFSRPDLLTTTDCFTAGTARLFLIDRYRFHIRPVARTENGTTYFDPYLVLDTGVDANLDGTIDQYDEFIVAEGIELLQVAYTLANGNVLGMTSGTAITATALSDGDAIGTATTGCSSSSTSNTVCTPTFPNSYVSGQSCSATSNASNNNPYVYSSYYGCSTSTDTTARTTNHQANIRSVRLAVIGRSPTRDIKARATLRYDSSFSLYDMNSIPTWISGHFPTGTVNADDGYQRVKTESSVSLPNMLSRGMPYF